MALVQSEILDAQYFLANPSAPTITTHGTTGSTTYTYKVVAKLANGEVTAASSAGTTTSGNATLNATNYDIVTITQVVNAVSYDIYRTAGGATQGKIANVLDSGSSTTVFNDQGSVGDTTTAPTVNTTGVGISNNVSKWHGFSVWVDDNGDGKTYKIQGSVSEAATADSASHWFDLTTGTAPGVASFIAHKVIKVRLVMTQASTAAQVIYAKTSGTATVQ